VDVDVLVLVVELVVDEVVVDVVSVDVVVVHANPNRQQHQSFFGADQPVCHAEYPALQSKGNVVVVSVLDVVDVVAVDVVWVVVVTVVAVVVGQPSPWCAQHHWFFSVDHSSPKKEKEQLKSAMEAAPLLTAPSGTMGPQSRSVTGTSSTEISFAVRKTKPVSATESKQHTVYFPRRYPW